MTDRSKRLVSPLKPSVFEARRQWLMTCAVLGLGTQWMANASAQQPFHYKPTRRGGGGTLRMLFWQGATQLNPHFAAGVKDQEGSRLFYEPLVREDAEGQNVPVLAAEIPTREGGGIDREGRWTVWKLKRDVTWHDGKPFTADDVVFNWRYATDPANGAISSGVYDNVQVIEKIDAHTVRVVFSKPTPLWDRSSGQQLIPQHVWAAHQGGRAREAAQTVTPVGTGPYRFVDFKPGDLVKGALNPNYHMPNRPYFDSVEIKGGGDATSAARAVLQTGEFDFAWNLQVEDEILRRMESGGRGRVVASASGDVEFLQFNLSDPSIEIDGERSHPRSRHPILADRAVREALSALFDRRAVQEFVWGRNGVSTVNILNNPADLNSTSIRREYNLERANALLDSAGWTRGAGGGVRQKGGRRLSLVFQTSVNSVRQKVQSIFKQSCEKAGIELELKAVTPAVFFSSDPGNPETFGRFQADLQMYAWSGRGLDPSRFMQQWVSWEAAHKANKWLGLNRGRWFNDEYDALYRSQAIELNRAKRAAMLMRMNDIICNEYAVIPIVYRPSVNGLARNLVAPMTGWDNALSALHDWYREA